MPAQTKLQVRSLTDVETAFCVAENVDKIDHSNKLAPQVGLEPTTKRLTAARSTAELLRSVESVIKFSRQDLRPRRQAVNPD